MARTLSKFGVAFAGLGSLALAAGCGGGGTSGGVDRPSGALIVGGTPTVQKLNTPLGLTGSRGSGAEVYVSFNLKDKEYNPTDIQLEYGYDVNGDGTISQSQGDPSPDDEYFPCTPVPGKGDGLVGLDSSTARGSDHLFVWNSASPNDLPTKRFVTQDYQYSATGRRVIGSDGQPVFGNTPGIRLRMRANDLDGRNDRWGPWRTTAAFDLNNNLQPAVSIDASGLGLTGVTPNATGSAVDEDVVLNIKCIDEDSGLGFPDAMAVAVDYAFVAPGVNLAIPAQVAALVWFPASTFGGTADTGLSTASNPGTSHTYTWDSAKDAGTINGDYILRVTPFDSKSELGPTVRQTGAFRLDNYTIFTDAGASLAAARVGHRVTTLGDNRALITGGSTTVGGGAINTAELFYPGIGQTTLGAVASTASMATARAFHSQTRLFDDRILVAGGLSGAGATASIEIYDPVAGTWAAAPASLAVARARHAAVLLTNGDVLFAGGTDAAGNALASSEIYHVDTNTVTTVPGGMTAARHTLDGGRLPDGKVMFPGGTGTGGTALASTEIYNPATGTFSSGPAMASARAEATVSSATDGRVYVVGGVGLSSVEVFNPQTNTWSAGGSSLSSARSGHVGILLNNGRILAAGGFNGSAVVASADEFVTATSTLNAPNGSEKTGRRDAAYSLLNNGRVLIVGGVNAAGATLSSVEVYAPDGGFNYNPVAFITTPVEEQSHAFGALFNFRIVDPEQNNVRCVFQYSIAGAPWKACTSQGGPYLDATNDPDTIAGDINEGTVNLLSVAANSSLPIDPILKNTVGDHLFIWNMASDLPKADYPTVKLRCIPFGPSRGITATTNSFKIAKNTRVISRFEGFAGPVHGSIDLWYHLRDIDGSALTTGDSARVEFEYGIDLNGDQQILADDGESYKVCTEVTNPVGSQGLGNGYTLVTSKTYAARGVDPLGWHLFRWDSIKDIGSPDIGQVFGTTVGLKKVILRLTPYDNPNLFPPVSDPLAVESKGRQTQLSWAAANGLKIDLDTTNGLFLTRVQNEANSQFFQTFPTPNTGSIPFSNVKLDETIIFTFTQAVDPASVDGLVGLNSLKVMVGGVSGRQILGSYRSNVATKQVFFYPLLQEIKDNVAKYVGTEAQTILFRGNAASVVINGYVPGTNPETAQVLRKNGWVAGLQTIDVANILARSYASAFNVILTPGTGAYVARGAPSSPTFTSSTPVHTSAGNATTTTAVTLNFTNQISGETASVTALRFRVDLNGNGIVDANDPVVFGKYQITNTAGTLGGTAKSVISFVIDPAYKFPASATILADFSGLAAGDGTLATGATAGRMNFATAAGLNVNSSFFETFTTTTQRDLVGPPASTALWNAAGFAGMLTGLRDGGSGADGVPTADSGSGTIASPKIFGGKTTYNFTSMTIPVGEVWRFTGTGSNSAVTILATTDIDIAGTLDLSGGDGESAIQDYPINSTAYPTINSAALKGGVGVAGGGSGANSQVTTSNYSVIDGLAGTKGFGAAVANAGGLGKAGLSYSVAGAGGGGGGHAQAGQDGGKYTNSTSTSYGTVGVGGTAYGSTTFASGLEGGCGGGSGSMTCYVYYAHGGAGGGGGGAVKMVCNGNFNLRGSGIIDVSGGDGGAGYYYYAGSGGGGSGGSCWIVGGSSLVVGGRIDVRGGNGGDPVDYNGASYSNYGRYGPFGGNGGAGRVRIEGPSIGSTTTNIIAGLSVATIGAGSLNGGTGARGAFPGSSTQTVNIDTITKTVVGGISYMDFNGMSIPAGVTVTLTGSGPAFIRVTGGVSISGKLQSNGAVGANGVYSGGSTGTYPAQTAVAAGVGGGAGGVFNTSSMNSNIPFSVSGGSGKGSGGGTAGQAGVYAPYTWSWGYKYAYYSGGGGGASNLLNRSGDHYKDGGRSRYNAGYYLPNNGGQGGVAGTPYTNPDSLLTNASFTGGSGGGPGAHTAYNTWGSGTNSWTTFYGGGGGGAGGGAISIDTSSTFTMGAAGSISVIGGNGGYGYTNVGGGGGGGGSGGNVIIRASSVSFASSGATIDTSGGAGSKSYNSVYYNDYNNGGLGGRGAVRIESVTAPSAFLNYGGILGYSASTASLTTATYVTGDTGTTVWVKGAGLAPNYTSQIITQQGNMDVNMEGAMLDPVTGARSTVLVATRELRASPVTAAVTDTIDGYIWYRYVFKMKVPSLVVPALPELYDVTVNRTHQQ